MTFTSGDETRDDANDQSENSFPILIFTFVGDFKFITIPWIEMHARQEKPYFSELYSVENVNVCPCAV